MAVITDTKARNIPSDASPIAHGGVVGLSLYSSGKKGRGKWMLRYVSPINGKRKKISLGTYPEITIAEVGKIGAEYREQIAKGMDPHEIREAKEEEKRALLQCPTFEEAARYYHAELLPGWKNKKHGAQWINTLRDYVFPVLGGYLLNKITPKLVADALRPIWLEKPETASRVKQRIHSVMGWGWANGYNNANPVDVVTHLLPAQPGKEIRQQHMPAMAWTDLPTFYKTKLFQQEPENVTRAVLEFLIQTVCRSGEVRGMTWDEIEWDTKTWIIPATRMKAKKIHRVPLNQRAIDILKGQQGQHPVLVFPSPSKGVQLSDAAMSKFLNDNQIPSTEKGRHATAHGFRSTFRDWCSENGVSRDIAERALAHTISNKVEAAYHRTDLLDDRRKLMKKWLEFLLPHYNRLNTYQPLFVRKKVS